MEDAATGELQRLPMRASAVYVVAASAWILFGDSLLLALGLELEGSAAASLIKGLAFVAVTAPLLFWLLTRAVAAHVRAREGMEQAARRYWRRLDTLAHGVLETGVDGRVQFANASARALLGMNGEGEAGADLGDYLQGVEAHRALEGALQAAASGEPATGTFAARVSGEQQPAVDLRFDWHVDTEGGDGEQVLRLEVTDVTEWVDALAASRRLAAVTEATSDLVATMDRDARITYLNAAGRQLLGFGDAQGSTGLLSACMPAWARRVMEQRALPEALRAGTWTGEMALLCADGREVPVSQVIIAHRDENGGLGSLSTIARDISERKKLDNALYTSREQYRSLVENTHDGIAVAQNGRVCYVNSRLARMLGFEGHQYIGERSLEFVHPEDREFVRRWYRAIRDGHHADDCIRFRFLTVDGSVRHVKARASTIVWEGAEAVLSFFEDITERVQAEGRLEYLAEFDALTGLPNRDLFLTRVRETLAGGVQATVAVVYLNLTRFQIFNDSHGHYLGDRLLRQVAERLFESMGDDHVVARIGGDEFVVMLSGLTGTDAIPAGVRSVFAAFQEPFRVRGKEFFVNASAGIAVYPDDSDDPMVLLRDAAIALEDAKHAGPGAYRYYAPGLNEQARRRLVLETDLRHALGRGEFDIHFQPQVDLADGTLKGTEALLRWNHGTQGMIMPGDFIPLLEESDLILEVGAWVLRQACEMQRHWERRHGIRVRVSVNLSARQLDDPTLVQRVSSILEETLATPECVELEITESSLVHNPARAASTLESLKGLGLSIAVDDFGTGYSSLSYFRRFPVDTIKIDKAFVADVTSDPGTAEIVRAIVAMGHSLGCELVAEGVETFGQLRFLRRSGCDWMQGYYVTGPLPAGQFEELVRQQKSLLGDGGKRDDRPSVVVISRNPGLQRRVSEALSADAAEPTLVSTAADACEAMAVADRAALIVDGAPCDMDPLILLKRTRALYPGVRRILIGNSGDVLLAAQVGEELPLQELLVQPPDQQAIQRALTVAIARWRAPAAVPLRRY